MWAVAAGEGDMPECLLVHSATPSKLGGLCSPCNPPPSNAGLYMLCQGWRQLLQLLSCMSISFLQLLLHAWFKVGCCSLVRPKVDE